MIGVDVQPPTSEAEIMELSPRNSDFSADDERIARRLPDLDDLPSPEEFAELIARLDAVEPGELRLLWKKAAAPRQIPHLEQLVALSHELSADFEARVPWERSLLAAGHEGGAAVEAWLELRVMVEGALAEWQKSRALLLAQPVVIHADTDLADLRRGVQQVSAFLERGGSLDTLTLLWRRDWKRLLSGTRVNGSVPSVAIHVQAIESQLSLLEGRRRLRERWSTQAEPIGLPAFETLGDPPEPVLRRIADKFPELLGWWGLRSTPIHELIESTGFDWDVLRGREAAGSIATTPFDLDVRLLGEPLQHAVATRLSVARRLEAEERLDRLAQQLAGYDGATYSTLRGAVRDRDATGYAVTCGNLLVHARRTRDVHGSRVDPVSNRDS